MKLLPLLPTELALLRSVFRRHPEITQVRLFGSRAKGTHSLHSDIDLALWGYVSNLQAESIGAELDELPLPYRFDVKAFDSIKLPSLREHIERVGIVLYPEVITHEVEDLFRGLRTGRKSFWTTVEEAYKNHEISHADVVMLLDLGLRETTGSYKALAELFHLPVEDYKRLMDFLRRTNCLIDFRPYQTSVGSSK